MDEFFYPKIGGLVFGCIDADFAGKIYVSQQFSSYTIFAHFCVASNSDFITKIDPKFDQFSVWIWDGFGVASGPQLGVIFGLCGAQVRPSSVQNPS